MRLVLMVADWGRAEAWYGKKMPPILSTEFDQQHSKGELGFPTRSWGSICSALLGTRFSGISNDPVGNVVLR